MFPHSHALYKTKMVLNSTNLGFFRLLTVAEPFLVLNSTLFYKLPLKTML